MKVIDLNVSEPRSTQYMIPPEENFLPIFLGHDDVQALGRLRSRWNLVTHEETIKRAIEERHSLKGFTLTLTKTGRHVNQGTIWLEKDVRKTVIKEAAEEGISVADYVRGILYSLDQKLAQEEISERERKAKIKHDNRVLSFRTFVQPEIREKLYKKYGRLSDRDLMATLQQDAMEWLMNF
ncbi:hypothetical protein HFZ78_13435 [Priestia megaterium]|uniref:Uncharacterized protein n=1 Tax=Priestia megaterium TaxID=1404 RepID=A0A6H1P1Z5_PRIMG|nr:hypothetical protein [Priestia megaterium]QIZ07610.1 hypothetical protein HFZ78_13435 [Priestia megaterium]